MKSPELIDKLTERIATDPEFREMFSKTPGKASNAMGIPHEDFQKMLAEVRAGDEIALADRDSAGYQTLYGRLASGIKGALGYDDCCACDYNPTRWADSCVI
jgi:hypothetical protein